MPTFDHRPIRNLYLFKLSYICILQLFYLLFVLLSFSKHILNSAFRKVTTVCSTLLFLFPFPLELRLV